MKSPAPAVIVLALACQGAPAAAQEQRPSLKAASAVRIANYGAPSVLLESRDKAGPILEDLNELRRRPWQRGDTRLSCYSTIVVTAGKKTLGTFRVTREHVVEKQLEKGVTTSFSIAVGPTELSRLSKALSEIAPAKDCN